MKKRVSIKLDAGCWRVVEVHARRTSCSRAAWMAVAVRRYLEHVDREVADERDRAILDLHADAMNQEAAEVPSYQLPRW